MTLPLIPQDKANHFVYGNILCFVLNLFFIPTATIITIFVLALGKEIYDYVSKKGTPEIMDIVWTMIGVSTTIITQINK